MQRFLEANRDGLEVASRQSTVCGIAFGKNQEILLLARQNVIIGAEEAADIGHAVFLSRHGATVAEREHLLRNLLRSLKGVSRLAQLDEIGILGKSACVEIQRNAVPAADRAHGT